LRNAVTGLKEDWLQAGGWRFAILGVLAAIAFLALIVALAPPWAYDGLMYHLVAPRLFFESGRIIPLPGILQANGPLLGQMLYAIGLGFGTDTFAQVIHLSCAGTLVLAVLAAGRRLLGRAGGWIAAGILLGIPILPLWGTLAYVDMIQALFEFLAVWMLLRWSEEPGRVWLGLSALMAGLALGTKLMGLFMVPALCLWLMFLARRRGWLRALGLAAGYGLVVGLIAAPWYLFSFVTLGDPVYPFLHGGAEWPTARLALHLTYLRSFGAGNTLLDFVLLPWNLYFHHNAFAALMGSIEYPSLVFPLVLLVPIVSLSTRVRALGVLSLLRLATWFVGSQQMRFLLPLYPVWALMAAGVLMGLEKRLHLRLGYPRLSAALTSGLVATTLVYLTIFSIDERPLATVTGAESRATYLERRAYDYPAMRFISSSLGPTDRVLELWDGQSYYCNDRCIPDAGQVQAPFLFREAPTVGMMADALAAQGATHVLLDLEGLNFLLLHDPEGDHLRAAKFFLDEFLPECGKPVYRGTRVQVYRLACKGNLPATESDPASARSSATGVTGGRSDGSG
jgi:4-amino-4-deoxy-L-arabinose transferase-like glycosyltransferase